MRILLSIILSASLFLNMIYPMDSMANTSKEIKSTNNREGEEDYSDVVDRAKKLIRGAQFEQASEALLEVPKDDSLYPKAAFLLSLTQLNLEQYEQAIKNVTLAIDNSPSVEPSDLYYQTRGLAYALSHQYLKAIEDYTQAVKLNPDSVESYYQRALSFLYLKEFNSAIKDLNQAIKIDNVFSANKEFNLGLAKALSNKSNIDQASRHIQTAIEIDTSKKDRYSEGRNLLKQITESSNQKETEHLIDKLFKLSQDLEINPNLTERPSRRAQSIESYNRGVITSEKAVNGKNPIDKRRAKEAYQYLTRAIYLYPYFPEAYTHRSFVSSLLGNYEESMRDMRVAMLMRPQYETKTEYQYQQKLLEAAITQPENTQALLLKYPKELPDNLIEKLGDQSKSDAILLLYNAAEEKSSKAIEVNQKIETLSKDLTINLEDFLSLQGFMNGNRMTYLNEATDYIKSAFELAPFEQQDHRLLAVIKSQKGDHYGAFKSLLNAALADPSRAETYLTEAEKLLRLSPSLFIHPNLKEELARAWTAPGNQSLCRSNFSNKNKI